MTKSRFKYTGPMAEAVIHPWGDVVFRKGVETVVDGDLAKTLKKNNDFEEVFEKAEEKDVPYIKKVKK